MPQKAKIHWPELNYSLLNRLKIGAAQNVRTDLRNLCGILQWRGADYCSPNANYGNSF